MFGFGKKDEEVEARSELETHLAIMRSLRIDTWFEPRPEKQSKEGWILYGNIESEPNQETG